MKLWTVSLLMTLGAYAWAQEESSELLDREPAGFGSYTIAPAKVKTYPGGADEEDLKVQSNAPDAPLTTDARTLQRDVYRDLYKQELKDERHDAVEE